MPSRKPTKTKSRALSRRATVWVIVHCEYFARADGPFVDEMVFHVAGSLAAVQRYVRRHGVSPHSWWMVEEREVDQPDSDADDRPRKHFFTHRGQPRKSAPELAARRAFDKLQREEAGG